MQRVIETGRVPVKLWTDEVEPGAMEQIKNLAAYPFAFHHIAVMPDCHEGGGRETSTKPPRPTRIYAA